MGCHRVPIPSQPTDMSLLQTQSRSRPPIPSQPCFSPGKRADTGTLTDCKDPLHIILNPEVQEPQLFLTGTGLQACPFLRPASHTKSQGSLGTSGFQVAGETQGHGYCNLQDPPKRTVACGAGKRGAMKRGWEAKNPPL